METTTKLMCCPAQVMDKIPDVSVDLVLTSPPYPMIEMWDGIFTQQNERVGTSLSQGDLPLMPRLGRSEAVDPRD